MNAPRPRAQLHSRRRTLIVTFVILAAMGFLLARGLGTATVYFKTADQAVADKAKLGDRRFRIEGDVVAGTIAQAGDGVDFTIISKGVKVSVRHTGDPPELFQAGIPVVLEGHFLGDRYESDRILVRHSSEYRAGNPDRVKNYVGKGSK